MRIAYFGSGEFGLDCLNAIKSSKHELSFIVTQPPNPAGRGRKPNPTPVAHWAMQNLVPFMETSNVNTADNINQISTCHNPDLIVVIAFGQKISQKLVELPPKGAINVHASLLPKYRGAAPINAAIINGDATSGVSIITLAQKMDAGSVLATAETGIAPDETAGSLHDKLAQLAAPVLLDTLDKIENGTAVYTEQDHDKATLAPKLSKSDGHIDFNEPRTLSFGHFEMPGMHPDFPAFRVKPACFRFLIVHLQQLPVSLFHEKHKLLLFLPGLVLDQTFSGRQSRHFPKLL